MPLPAASTPVEEPCRLAAFAALVRRARSCRRFVESDPIPAALLRELVDLARFVPSAGNRQPLRYRVVSEPAERADVFPCLRWAGALKTWPGPAAGERPTGYIVLVRKASQPLDFDSGIAAQTIQLAATAAGYAACMLDAIDRPALHRVLRLQSEQKIELLLALGRPGEPIVLEDLAPGADHAYWRTPDGVHHVPKRRLADVLLA